MTASRSVLMTGTVVVCIYLFYAARKATSFTFISLGFVVVCVTTVPIDCVLTTVN